MLRKINPKQALPRKYDNILPVRNWAPTIRAKPTENRNGFVKRTFMTFILLLCGKYTNKISGSQIYFKNLDFFF
tara:strand:+ start:164 stop:385 length:222 start_codon:yes stop_codon:yes gene_type:complete